MKPLELFIKTGTMALYYASKRDTLIQRIIASKVSKSVLGVKIYEQMQIISIFLNSKDVYLTK